MGPTPSKCYPQQGLTQNINLELTPAKTGNDSTPSASQMLMNYTGPPFKIKEILSPPLTLQSNE